MTLGASTFAGFLGDWAQGCLVVLIAFWLLLALLGVRNGRFPRRLIGGAAFVVGSALWIGLHRSLAESLHLDAGDLGQRAWLAIGRPLADSGFALSAIGALLLVSSLVGLLVAIDWLPFAPLRPLLLGVERRMRGAGGEQPAAPPALPIARAAAAPALERAPARNVPAAAAVALPVVEPLPSSEPDRAAAAAPAAPPVSGSSDVSPTMLPSSPDADALSAASEDVGGASDDAPVDPPTAAPTDWARFRRRAAHETDPVPPPDLAVDNDMSATHNSSTPEGESRASSEDADAAGPSGEPDAIAPVAPTETEEKDPPVLDRDRLEEAATATLPCPPEQERPDQELEVELLPRRKKEEPEEEPEKEPDEPGEDDEESDEEEGEDGEEWEEGEEGEEDEEFDEDEDEEWEDEEEEEEGEEEEEEDEEEDDEAEDEDEDDDEDWDDEDDEEDKDDKDDKEEDKEDWDDDKGASDLPPPSAESTLVLDDASPPAPLEDAPIESGPAPVLASAPETSAATVTPAAPEVPAAAEPDAPPELPAHLFSDLPEEERQLVARAIDRIAGTESVSLSRLQRELGVTYYAAARVFERLEQEGCIAPYTGSLARAVRVSRAEWDERRQAS